MGHHLIMGSLTDALTGEALNDTHDERYRQRLTHLLLNDKGYARSELRARQRLTVYAGARGGTLAIDLVVRLEGRMAMLIKYGPGSLVTRERSALAAGRLLAPYQIPVVVATNGEDAHIMDGAKGKLVATGLNALPNRDRLIEIVHKTAFDPIDPLRVERESRLLYCYEIDGACPCDDTVCRVGESS